MVLIMQTDIVGEEVQRAVVRERFRHRAVGKRVLGGGGLALEDVVLGDEVASAGMQGAREEGGEDQVEEGLRRAELDEGVVEQHLRCDVDDVDAGERHLEDEDGADGVEEDLEGAEEGFAKDRVEEYGFNGCGQVGIKPVDAERFVVR